MIQPVLIAGAANGLAGAALYFVSKEAPSLLDGAAWLYLLSSLVFGYLVWKGSTQSTATVRITGTGKYVLTREFVGLANEPSSFHEAGFVFNVTDTALADSVVFIPEFGGWTYYEIPAKRI